MSRQANNGQASLEEDNKMCVHKLSEVFPIFQKVTPVFHGKSSTNIGEEIPKWHKKLHRKKDRERDRESENLFFTVSDQMVTEVY